MIQDKLLNLILFTMVLSSTAYGNINTLKEIKPPAQQYTLNQFDPIWFYKADEIGWTRGKVEYLWGYYPVIFSKELNRTFSFNEVEWTIGHS